MKPEIVTQAPMPPGQCLFSQDQEGPWIDTGLCAPWVKPYGYLGVKYVESLARDLLGLVPKSEVDALAEQLEAYKGRIEELESFVKATVEYEESKPKELVA